MACCNVSLPEIPFYIGCDGKPWSDKFLIERMHEAAEEERYEFAAKCRDELNKRLKEAGLLLSNEEIIFPSAITRLKHL